jgi:hypothetical protein
MHRRHFVLCCATLMLALGCQSPHERIGHGMTGEQVLTLMGRPEFVDSWSYESGRAAQVFIYPVERRKPGSLLVRTTSFPVVLVDDRVVGWGDAVSYLGGNESLTATR